MNRQERIIQERLQRLIERMKKPNYNEYMVELVKERVHELHYRGVNCVDRFVQKLLDRIEDKESYLDILMEGRFAIILARNTFSKIQIEYAERGPDLKAVWNRGTVYFEVTRHRPGEQDVNALNKAIIVSPKKLKSVKKKIQDKLKQLIDDQINIIVLWSETITSSLIEVKEAVQCIVQESEIKQGKYTKLSGILFTENKGRDFKLFRNEKASRPVGVRLAKKLEFLHERDPKDLQREEDELATSLRRTMG